MNIVDVIIVLIILMFGVIGFKRGVIKEGVSFIGILLVFVISYTFKGVIGNVLCKSLPFLSFGDGFSGLVSINILVYQLIGFSMLFSVLMIAYHIVVFLSKIVQKAVNATIILTLPSALCGAVVGLVKGYFLAFIALLILTLPAEKIDIYNDSRVKDYILYKTPIVADATKDISSSLKEIADLVKEIQNKEVTTNDANLQILNTMLKYKMIDVHTIDQLIVLDKLKSVKNIDTVLDKYR